MILDIDELKRCLQNGGRYEKLEIIGGISPASTATYYSDINLIVNQTKGGNTTSLI